MTALCGIFCLALWVPAKSYAGLLIFALLSGTATGTFWGTVVPVTAEVVGLQRLPSAFGIICLPLTIPTIFAEPIALQLVSTSGYLSSKIFVGCMFLLGAASTWALRSWKICDIEDKERRERPIDPVDGSMYVKEKQWLTPRRLFMNKRV
jgi:predicted MFS family arabinose efflux permease